MNRLKQNMRLQSDPTIIYGLVGGKGYARPPDHAQRDRAADAVQHLCRSRACRRGRSPIPAAPRSKRRANPARTKELFFVADGTGGHAFADNYEQHQKNVARLRVLEQQRGSNAAPPAAAPAPAAPSRRAAPARAGADRTRGAAA